MKLPAFPESAWRGLFNEYRQLIGYSTEAPDAALFGSLAACLSFLVGRDASLPWGAGTISPIIQVLVLGTTGKARKSTALDDAVDIAVTTFLPKPDCANAPERWVVVVGQGSGEGYAEAIRDLEPLTQKKKGNGTKGGKSNSDEPTATDKTPAISLPITGRRGLFVIHEFGALLGKIARDSAGGMIDFLLNAFDARSIWKHQTRQRGNHSAFKITNGVAVVLAASTFDFLVAHLTEDQIAAGLLNRMLVFAGEPKHPLHRRPKIPQSEIDAFQNKIKMCLRKTRGKEFSITESGDQCHKAFYDNEYVRVGENGITEAATARKDALALRLAMLFAVADATTEIDVDHVKAAWDVVACSSELAEFLAGRLRESDLRQAENRVLAAAVKVAAVSPAGFTRRTVFQRLKGRSGMARAVFNAAFDALVRAGEVAPMYDAGEERYFLTPEPTGNGGLGGAGDRGTEVRQ